MAVTGLPPLRSPAARSGCPAAPATAFITLRPATPADAEFCYRLHKAATGDYITATRGWDEQVQRAFHDRAFNPHRWQIITAGQAGIGMLDTGYRPGEIYLSRIEIDPGHQRPGIGSRIVRALLGEAERTGQDLVPGVLTVSRRRKRSAGGLASPKSPATANGAPRSPCGPRGTGGSNWRDRRAGAGSASASLPDAGPPQP